VKAVGGISQDIGYFSVTDEDGNTFIAGTFQDTADFDPGVDVYHLISKGIQDIFILKLDQSGDLIWAGSIGGYEEEGLEGLSLGISGGIYLTGNFEGTIDIDPSPDSLYKTSAGSDDFFVMNIDTDGNLSWAHTFGSRWNDFAEWITIDQYGNVYVTGWLYIDEVDYDPGIGEFLLKSNGLYDVFILKLDAEGNFLWAQNIGGIGYEEGRLITVDKRGNIYISGDFYGTGEFDPGPNVYELTSVGDADIFIEKLDSNGQFQWVVSIGNAETNFPSELIVNDKGNIYLASSFTDSIDLDPGPGIKYHYAKGRRDIAVIQLDTIGSLKWSIAYGGVESESLSQMLIGNDQHLFLTGVFQDSVDFDASPSEQYLFSPGQDIYILELDSMGNFVNVDAIGGEGIEGSASIYISDLDEIYITGSFNDTSDFDPGACIAEISSTGDFDVFALKIVDCEPSTSNLMISACTQYTFNGYLLSDSGIYEDTVCSATGCDSVIILDLTIYQPSFQAIEIIACDSFYFDGKMLYESGIYYDTLSNQHSCDSIIELDLSINDSTNSMSFVTACVGYYFNNQEIHVSGTYYDTLINSVGCDSILILNLTILDVSTTFLPISTCDRFYFDGNMLYESGIYYDTLTNQNSCDSIIELDLTIQQSNFLRYEETACNKYDFNGQLLQASGTYLDTLTNRYECDSIIELVLEIVRVDTTVMVDGYTITANALDAQYQWLDCTNDFGQVEGETSQNFEAIASGSFAVEVTQLGCVDTSNCHPIVVTFTENPERKSMVLFPNPATNEIFLKSDDFKDGEVQIIDHLGNELQLEVNVIGSDFLCFNIAELPAGIYIISVKSDQIHSVSKFIKHKD
jgi:hypothetical protein